MCIFHVDLFVEVLFFSTKRIKLLRLLQCMPFECCANKSKERKRQRHRHKIRETIEISINCNSSHSMRKFIRVEMRKRFIVWNFARKCLLHFRCTIKLRWIEALQCTWFSQSLAHFYTRIFMQKSTNMSANKRTNEQISIHIYSNAFLSSMYIFHLKSRTFSIRTISCICSFDSFLLAFVVIDARKSKEEKKHHEFAWKVI